tara:strand:+ start:2024 stop:4174 length:2151 start_codon:yes stop_codon:yes gene_type:complete
MAFNTGNPVPSTDAKDLSDNAENFDSATNSNELTWTDRLGVTKDTLQGRLNKLGVIFDDPIRDWSASLLVSDLRAHRYPATTGDVYIPVKPLPFTTGGTFNTSDWALNNSTDEVLSLLSGSGGAEKIGVSGGGTVQQEITILNTGKEDIGIASSLVHSHDGNELSHPSLLASIAALESNQQAGVITFQTLALLNAYTPAVDEEKASFKVTNDNVSPGNNGYYSWDGAAFIQDASLVTGVIDENNTADAINGKAVVDYNVPLFGSSFTGASEYWETLSSQALPAVVLLDDDNRILFEGVDPVVYEEYETLSITSGDWLILDLDDRILHSNVDGTSGEVIEARGVQSTLNGRLNVTLDPYGMEISSIYGDWYLREMKQRTRADKSGTSTQLRVMNIGDSWTHLSTRYTRQLGIDLNEYMGAGGHAGFTGFSWGFGTLPTPSGRNTNYNPDETDITLVGAWTANYSTATSPDICSAQSSTGGDYIDLTTTTYGKVGTLYANNNGAVIRYQSDGGAWTNLTLNGTDEFYPLTLPDQVGVTIRLEVVSGTAKLYGVELHNLSGGAIISKVGATGTTLAGWATMSNDVQWRKNVQELAPNTITILHGTNDQGNFTKAEFKANGKTLIDNIRLVLPLADIMLIAPCENGRGFSPAMSEYQEAFSELAYENKCCYFNLQKVFGESYSEYGDLSARQWFENDLIHPVPTTGGYAIVDAIFKTFTK